MDTEFLSQCIREVFAKKKDVLNCMCTRDIMKGLEENFHVKPAELEPYFLVIEKELKKCMEAAGWTSVSITTYRQVIHSIFNSRLVHFRDDYGVWRTRRELINDQKKYRTRMIKKTVEMIIDFYQPPAANTQSSTGLIQMENLYNNLLTSGMLDCFGVNEFFFAVREVHSFLKSEGFIEEGLHS